MEVWLPAVVIGAVSGLLSGAFGIGGGIITTPAISLVLGAPALVAVGTPLPVILPSAVTGALSYARHGLVEWRPGLLLGVIGAATSVGGALLATQVGGPIVLIATALLIFYAAGDTLLQVITPTIAEKSRHRSGEEREAASARAAPGDVPPAPDLDTLPAVVIGVVTGLYSGFFGLGGGFVLVPLLTRWGRFPLKRAIPTSLLAVAVLAVPGTITHAALGNVDWGIALALSVGVVPGAALGARISLGTSERMLRIGFALLLIFAGGLLAAQQFGVV